MMVRPGTDADKRRLLALSGFLEDDLRHEVARLYAAEDLYRELLTPVDEQQRTIHRAQAVAGDRTAELASLRGRLAELAPDQVAIARRDATFLGHGYLRVTARGRLRFDVERIAPGRVSVRDADH
jgi:hypothetical protein